MINWKTASLLALSGFGLAWVTRTKSASVGCSCSRTQCSCKKGWEGVSVGRSPYNLHHANASRFKAVGELLLLEDHLINDPCPECMNKHSITASRLMSEAASLEDGQMSDIDYAESIEEIRTKLKPENDIPLAAQTRDLRKKLQKSLNLSHGHVDGPEDNHEHA